MNIVHFLKKYFQIFLIYVLIDDIQSIGQDFVSINGKFYRKCENGFINEITNNCIKAVEPICPENFKLINGICYPYSLVTKNCSCNPYDMSFNSCYSCQSSLPVTSTMSTTTTMKPETITTTPITTTTELLILTDKEAPVALTRCPPHYILYKEKCRQVFCSSGEFYQGRCLQAACPENTVWYNHQCQSPEYITTIIEIENTFLNETNIIQPNIITANLTKVEYHDYNKSPSVIAENVISTTEIPTNLEQSSTKPQCCRFYTPRICKFYNSKWICFNKIIDRCYSDLCTKPRVYLKPPEMVYKNSILIMPPNPPLKSCKEEEGCRKNNKVDCSGCAINDAQTCTPQCYMYFCNPRDCKFLDLEEFCYNYPLETPCVKGEGCTWDWCK